MMTLGTVGAFGFADFHPPEILGLYAGAGCAVVQVYRNREKTIAAADVVAICADVPLKVDSLHGFFGDDMDPSSEDESVRQTTIELYRSEADYCRAVGGHMVVVHPSPAHAPAGNLENRYRQFRRSLEDLARVGEQTGVRFGVENMPPYHPVGADIGRLCDAIESVGNTHVEFVLDTGHAHMTGGIVPAIESAGRRIRNTHVHDNDGVNDTHRLPYVGTLPWADCGRALRNVGYDGVFLLEVFESADDLRRLLNDEWNRNIAGVLGG